MTGVSPSYYGEIGEDRYEAPTFYRFVGRQYCSCGTHRGWYNVDCSGATTYHCPSACLVTSSTRLHRQWNGTGDDCKTPTYITIYYRYGNGEEGTYYFRSDGSPRYEDFNASQLEKQVSYRIPGWVNE